MLHVVCEQTKGELSSERKEKCETMQHNFQKLLQTTQTLAVSCVVLMIVMWCDDDVVTSEAVAARVVIACYL